MITSGCRTRLFTPLRIAWERDMRDLCRIAYHDVHQLARHHDGFHNFLLPDGGLDFFICQGALAHEFLRAISGNGDASSELAIHLYADLDFLRLRERRIKAGPRL